MMKNKMTTISKIIINKINMKIFINSHNKKNIFNNQINNISKSNNKIKI
jgi:hypothetical protein